MRDTLLTIEKMHTFTYDRDASNLMSNDIMSSDIAKDIVLSNAYSQDDILYSIKQLSDSNLIDFKSLNVSGLFLGYILDITPSGHEFLENIRNNDNWGKVKNVSKSVGSQSISVIKEIAVDVITSAISSQFK